MSDSTVPVVATVAEVEVKTEPVDAAPPKPKQKRVRKADLTPEQLETFLAERVAKRKEARKARRESGATKEREKEARKAYRERQKALVLMGKKWREEAKMKDDIKAGATEAVKASVANTEAASA
jgi:hypothetical protein